VLLPALGHFLLVPRRAAPTLAAEAFGTRSPSL
jgi:hypothetical protein